jgi:hypothetical protein
MHLFWFDRRRFAFHEPPHRGRPASGLGEDWWQLGPWRCQVGAGGGGCTRDRALVTYSIHDEPEAPEAHRASARTAAHKLWSACSGRVAIAISGPVTCAEAQEVARRYTYGPNVKHEGRSLIETWWQIGRWGCLSVREEMFSCVRGRNPLRGNFYAETKAARIVVKVRLVAKAR